jgi:hypothetical protein
MAVSGSSAPVATHQTAKLRPRSETTKAPMAAGLKMCRPRIASRYLDALATA